MAEQKRKSAVTGRNLRGDAENMSVSITRMTRSKMNEITTPVKNSFTNFLLDRILICERCDVVYPCQSNLVLSTTTQTESEREKGVGLGGGGWGEDGERTLFFTPVNRVRHIRAERDRQRQTG